MKGDFSRSTYRREKHFRTVRMQQGRVQLDADWNELVDAQSDLQASTSIDTIGREGAPLEAPGFRIEAAAGGGDLHIGTGRFYAEGLLCRQDDDHATFLRQPDLPGLGEPELDLERFETDGDGTWVVLSRARVRGRTLQAGDLVQFRSTNGSAGEQPLLEVAEVQAPASRFRVDGDLTPYQSGSWTLRLIPTRTSHGGSATGMPLLPHPARSGEHGTYLVYLDTWEQHVTHLEDRDIHEVALGGPDTGTRTRLRAQVKLVPTDPAVSGDPPTCGLTPGGMRELLEPPPGTLRARAEPRVEAADVCESPPEAGYQGLENQLYRVEIHRSGDAGAATFKWSRDNGAITARLIDINGDLLVFSRSGPNLAERLALGGSVELIDQPRVLRGEPGFLVEAQPASDEIGTNQLIVTRWPDDLPLAMEDFDAGTAIVRHWDSVGDSPAGPAADNDGYLRLGPEGVQVRFSDNGAFRCGDYWQIPARTIGQSVEWPQAGGEPEACPPHGIAHHYAELAVVAFDETGATVQHDCRVQFPPLTQLVHLEKVGGDGQEAMRGEALPRPLLVRVLRGGVPIEGATVRFEIASPPSGDGALAPLGGAWNGPSLEMATDAEGLAGCRWRPDTATWSQHVIATLVTDDAGRAGEQYLHFNANLSVANQVDFDVTPPYPPTSPDTVQAALDELRANIDLAYVSGDGQDGIPGDTPERLDLPAPLVVRVANGAWPKDGETVTFTVAAGGGKLRKEGQTTLRNSATVTTDAEGLAWCYWRLGGSERHQQVEATLDIGGAQVLPIRFNATLSRAEDVGYVPTAFPAESQPVTVRGALDDLRENFSLAYVGGDGQSAARGEQLPQPLQVRVANGRWPAAGQIVQFQRESPEGLLALPDGTEGQPLEAQTDADGLASCLWTLGVEPPHQRVRAVLLDGSGGSEIVGPLYFNASVKTEAGVSRRIHQPGHGFVKGEAIFFDPDEGPDGRYRRARADDVTTTGLFIVAEVYASDPDHFVLLQAGYLEFEPGELPGGEPFSPGHYYFVSPDTEGTLIRDEPTGISNPIFYADHPRGGYVLPYRPAESSQELLRTYIDELLVGSVVAFATEAPPEGWLECNGDPISRRKFARLFQRIGTRFGPGDGETTFNLPDLQGRFVRGWAHGSFSDPDRDTRKAPHPGGEPGDHVGTYQSDALQDHWHTDAGHGHGDAGHRHFSHYGNFSWPGGGGAEPSAHTSYPTAGYGTGHASISGANANVRSPTLPPGVPGAIRTSSETRGRNVALMYCIKW